MHFSIQPQPAVNKENVSRLCQFCSLVMALALGLAWTQAKDLPVASQQEFDAALTNVQPGDVVVFKNGV